MLRTELLRQPLTSFNWSTEKAGKRCQYLPPAGEEVAMLDFRDQILVCVDRKGFSGVLNLKFRQCRKISRISLRLVDLEIFARISDRGRLLLRQR